jgi:hypothetical protein
MEAANGVVDNEPVGGELQIGTEFRRFLRF